MKAQTIQEFTSTLTQGFELFDHLPPVKKLGDATTLNICPPLDLQTPHSETEDFYSPNMTKSKYRTSFMGATRCSDAYRTTGVVVKVCI